MAKYMFRDLRADEIECRVSQAKDKGVSLLLYKDARCDQNILDETVGPMGWTRFHSRDNANCTVSIWDEKKQMWVGKEDTGTESNTEKEKGLASDSFKRACFNWGIGRELYTAPFIWIDASGCEKLKFDDKAKKWKCNDTFDVDTIEIVNKKITALTIKNTKTKRVVFSMNAPAPEPAQKQTESARRKEIGKCIDCGRMIADCGDITAEATLKASMKRWGEPVCYACAQKRLGDGR